MSLRRHRRVLAGRPLRRPGGVAPPHPPPPRARAARSSPPPSSSPTGWSTPASTRRCCPAGPGLTCDFGPEHAPRIALRADMDALPMAERTGAAVRVDGARTSRTPAATTRTPRCCSARRLALASVPELPVGVRLIFQPAEELMPGGAIDAIAAGALTGVSRIFALHCDPRLAVGRVAIMPGPITSAADSDRDHAALAGRAHLATASDRRPGLRAGHADHRAARGAVAAHRPAAQHGDGVGRGQRRRRGQRHPADRHAGRHRPHRQPRDLGVDGSACRARSFRRLLAPLGIEHIAAVPPRCAAGGQRGASRPGS